MEKTLQSPDHRSQISDRWLWVLAVLFLAALLIKFFWPLFSFDGAPLGYDPGFYRYLFIRHADAFPPFWVAPMDEWARGHPLGLFFFTTILLRIGMPVSWLLGWIWNLMPVLLAVILAWAIGMRRSGGVMIGALVLLAAFLSIPFFDGFAAMYWKTYASLAWCVLTYRFIEKKSWWGIPTGILCVATHHQTGLLFGLVFASWVLIRFFKDVRAMLPFVLGGLVVAGIGFLAYLPVLKDAVLVHIPDLLAGKNPGGSFPPALFYLRTEGILLAFGAVGFVLSFRREHFTLWQLSVLWSFLFVAAQLFFYRRFFLQLDFFLLPFAAIAIHDFWLRFSRPLFRGLLVGILLVQAVMMVMVIQTRGPITDPGDFHAITAFAGALEPDAFVLGLDNQTSTLLRGWLPYTHVGGPGLFESHWSYEEWEVFLMGTHEDRVRMLSTLAGPVYIYISPFFVTYYGESVAGFLNDPCFEATDYQRLYRVLCKQ